MITEVSKVKQIPEKAKKGINRTKEILEEYKCTFIEYMRDSCHRRDDIDLGENVIMGERKCIICGWNGSCNYDVYFFDKDIVANVHPYDIKKDNT